MSPLLPLLLVALLAQDGDRSPEQALKEKGFKRTGTSYVLVGETEFSRRLDAARGTYRALSLAVAQKQALDQGTQSSKDLVRMLTQQRILLNQQLASATTVEQNNQLVAMINQVTDRINLLREGTSDPRMGEELRSLAAKKREEYLQALLDLRSLADKITSEYKTLADDAEVKSALGALNQNRKVKLVLGPSRAFQSNVKLLERAESAIQTDAITLRREGGVFWVDVTLNGKTHMPMVFDTGAAIVSLPAAAAARAGIRSSPSDPTIRLKAADGSVTEGKLVKLPSVGVGKFVAENVEAAILPDDKKDAPPLLGSTFLSNFTYKVNAETGTLSLSRVETAPAPRAGSARPASPKKGARKSAVPAEGKPEP